MGANAQKACNRRGLHTRCREQGAYAQALTLHDCSPKSAVSSTLKALAHSLLTPSVGRQWPQQRGKAMVDKFTLGRRALLGSAAGMAAFGLAGRASAQKPLVIGFIYVGPRDDYGYNQAHAEAAAILKKMPGLKVVEEEKGPETVAVEKSMESMINLDGA